jgi:UTP--glucose-1-phosphate uridylyltransferase
MSKIRKCVIPAAGKGTRLFPLTRAQPKEMLPVLDKPVIHYVVEEAIKSGLDEILIVIGSGKDAIINYFDKHTLDEKYEFDDFPDIFFVRQKGQKGLADAIRYAEHFTGDDDFVVLLGDTIYKSGNNRTVTSQILAVYERTAKPCIAVEKVPKEKVIDYGIVDAINAVDDPFKIKGVVEKPDVDGAPSDLGITGIYVLGKYVYDYISKVRPGKNGELQLSDVYNLMLENMDVYASRINGKRYDIGTMDLWINTFMEFAKEREIA